MKKLNFFGMAIALAMGTTATAQQLTNGGFDSTWEDCVPWTSNNNTKSIGTQPQNWTISHVIGINGTGKTSVANQVAGYNNSTNAVELVNSANSTLPSQTVPGYITLGTTWSTSVLGSKNDGGTFGGIEFTHTPDALSFYYKRSHGTASNSLATTDANEPATVLAYLWKGTWTQADVPGNIISFGSPKKVSMTDRERNILGITTDLGGTVSKTDDAELIASLNYSIEGDASEWTQFVQPLTYTSTSTPAKLNVIIAANDYFAGASAIGQNNKLTVDDVKLVYYSRLQSLAINGVAVEGFSSDTYSYIMSGAELPAESAIEATVMGRSAVKSISIDEVAATVTITVSNVDADLDGEKSHSYVLQYEKSITGKSTDYSGYLNVKGDNGDGTYTILTENKSETITITEYDNGTCDFLLPNFEMEIMGSVMPLGNIEIKGATFTTNTDGTKTYNGYVDDMQLEMDIVADVTLNGTIASDGEVNMKIDVVWENTPILCTFTSKAQTGIDDVEVAPAKNQTVDVYTITGVKVLENVYPADAVKILDKGFYIIGNKKVVVK